jgi:hypothetical protein
MPFVKNALVLLLTMFITGCIAAQEKKKVYKFKEVGWTIQVPDAFTVLDSIEHKSYLDQGQKAIENTYDTSLDFSASRTLIAMTIGDFNQFSSTITPFDPAVDGSWKDVENSIKLTLMETISSQAPQIAIDTSSSVAVIDKLRFNIFYIKMTYPNKLVLHSYLYTRLHRGYDLGISFSYMDEAIGKQMKEIIATSKFDK